MALSAQAPSSVFMIRPHAFLPNPQTAADNGFQRGTAIEVDADRALSEADGLIALLRANGVRVHTFDDLGTDTPDSVFPNNWCSTHAGGHVVIYPMFAENRRRERRWDVVEMLKRAYRVQDVIDYSGLEPDGVFLEGTGAMVLDHLQRIAYVCRSNRADPVALERFATQLNFEPIAFDATDAFGAAIYHTNVLMCVATEFALVGLDCIADTARRAEVRARLVESGRDVIALTQAQIAEFCGNAMELTGADGRLLVMSTRARAALKDDQVEVIERSARILTADVTTIEMAGGSVRCMIAGIHLSPRSDRVSR